MRLRRLMSAVGGVILLAALSGWPTAAHAATTGSVTLTPDTVGLTFVSESVAADGPVPDTWTGAGGWTFDRPYKACRKKYPSGNSRCAWSPAPRSSAPRRNANCRRTPAGSPVVPAVAGATSRTTPTNAQALTTTATSRPDHRSTRRVLDRGPNTPPIVSPAGNNGENPLPSTGLSGTA